MIQSILLFATVTWSTLYHTYFLLSLILPAWRALIPAAAFFIFFQIRYCITPRQRCGLTHMSPRDTTASPLLMPGSRSTMIPLVWRLPLLAPTLWGLMGMMGRQQRTSCRSNSSSSSLISSSRINYNSCSRSNRSSTTSNSSSCSISNNRCKDTQFNMGLRFVLHDTFYSTPLMHKPWTPEQPLMVRRVVSKVQSRDEWC